MDDADLESLAQLLNTRREPLPEAVYDDKVDLIPGEVPDPLLLPHIKHQLLFRCYQLGYVLLPLGGGEGRTMAEMQEYYRPEKRRLLQQLRGSLEAELLESCLETAPLPDSLAFVERLFDFDPTAAIEEQFAPADPSRKKDFFRDFVIQSSIDLCAEASASAMGVIGEYGPIQSSLFHIVMDEFGHGSFENKHSSVFRSLLRSLQLREEYNSYWPVFYTSSLILHNTIHCLFQNPANLFKQFGFLLHAETAYQASTAAHFAYLKRELPEVDGAYFKLHAEIDIEHSRLMREKVIRPALDAYGEGAASEIRRGWEITKAAFEQASSFARTLYAAIEALIADGAAMVPGISELVASRRAMGLCVTPSASALAEAGGRWVQVGGIGALPVRAFRHLPEGTIGRLLD